MHQAQRVVGEQDTGRNARVPKQALQPLVRSGFPARQGAPRVWFHPRRLASYQDLPAGLIWRHHCKLRLQHRFGCGQHDAQRVWDLRTVGAACDLRRTPVQYLREKRPWIAQSGGALVVTAQELSDCLAVQATLLCRHKRLLGKCAGRYDDPNRLDLTEPMLVDVLGSIGLSAHQPVTGQR
ncbi:hypothetical protein EAH89_13020 [Roseomonas nepalensis]|uniref:Uncharacterized protein n=1 Tax=Muricoccus nepalensis TaxID=1854500 RepID=A0A502G2R5_9PROT|nr:hypothetical protein EAH89_13020 [Roseomonas nepalensis]